MIGPATNPIPSPMRSERGSIPSISNASGHGTQKSGGADPAVSDSVKQKPRKRPRAGGSYGPIHALDPRCCQSAR